VDRSTWTILAFSSFLASLMLLVWSFVDGWALTLSIVYFVIGIFSVYKITQL
jgi:hypothetical protein